MTEPRTCPDCGLPEERKNDKRGRPVLNLDPSTSRCLRCTIAAAATRHTFHSRRDDRQGEVVDTKALAARNDE